MAKKFREASTMSEGLKNQFKPTEIDKVYYLYIPQDLLEQWSEIWPCFVTPDGIAKRRFVGDVDKKNANLAPIFAYKRDQGTPEGLTEQDQKNWSPTYKDATIVAIGTEVSTPITKEMIAKAGPAQKEKLMNQVKGGVKVIRRVVFDKNNLKVWVFGSEMIKQIMGLNADADNQEKLAAKGLNIEDVSVTNAFALKLTKSKKGAKAWEVAYKLELGQFVGVWEEGTYVIDPLIKELSEYVQPSAISDIEEFISSNAGGGSSGMEVEATEELPAEEAVVEEEIVDVTDLPDVTEEEGVEEEVAPPAPKAKATAAKAKAPVAAPAPKAKAKAPVAPAPVEEPAEEATDDDMNFDDLDALLDA